MGGAVAALCFGNGFPQMHVRGKVGLSIDYWKKRRLAMEEGKPEKGGVGEQDIWRILIEVQEIPPHDYAGMPPVAPIRVSNEWVSDEVMKPKYPPPISSFPLHLPLKTLGTIPSSATSKNS